MSKQLLQESIQQVQQEMQNAENETKAVNAAAEYFTQADLENAEKLDNKDIAEELNKNFNTNLNEDDIQKIENVVKAEQNGDIENVGWDKADNNINMQEINKIYNENEDVFKQENMQTENRMQQESKTEKNEEGFLDKAKEAIANKFEELQQAAQNVDIHAALRNSDNAFDRAQAEFFDQIDQFTQNLHNQQKDNTTQDKNEEKTIDIPLKNSNDNEKTDDKNFNNIEKNDNDKDLNLNNENMQKDNKELNNYVNQNNEKTNEKEENISKETQEKLEAKAEQAQAAETETKEEKAAEIEASR